MEDLHIAGIRRLAVEHEMAQRRAAEFLAEQGVLHEFQTGPSGLFWNLRREESHFADSIALQSQSREQFAEGFRQQVPLERIDLIDQELTDRFERLLQGL